MNNPIIAEFFQNRKEAWLKKNLKASMSDTEVQASEFECEQIFALENWLPSAANRASQISLSTHPCTFSHPSARKNKNGYVTSIIANSERANDGYLRSGNVFVEPDALGNAAALDVYKFLTLKIDEEFNLLDHIRNDSGEARALLDIKTADYNSLKAGFMAMAAENTNNVTSAKIKQVYFPVESDYHQLSLLTASGLLFELRKRIDYIRFSEQTKSARSSEKNNEYVTGGYKQLPSITTIGYGGTKPQNISVLNNANGGKVHLLSSSPPTLQERSIQFPSSDFFQQTFNFYRCKDLFLSLHSIYSRSQNNQELKLKRDYFYDAIIDRIIEKSWQVREVSNEQFNSAASRLKMPQKIWLCNNFIEQREEEDSWIDELIFSIARYIVDGYKKVLGGRAVNLSDTEFSAIQDYVVKNKEAFR